MNRSRWINALLSLILVGCVAVIAMDQMGMIADSGSSTTTAPDTTPQPTDPLPPSDVTVPDLGPAQGADEQDEGESGPTAPPAEETGTSGGEILPESTPAESPPTTPESSDSSTDTTGYGDLR